MHRLRILANHIHPNNTRESNHNNDNHHHSIIQQSPTRSTISHFSDPQFSASAVATICENDPYRRQYQQHRIKQIIRYVLPHLKRLSLTSPSSSSSQQQQQQKWLLQKMMQKQHHFNMIEILIAISIIVTFSGLTGTVFAQKYEETRVSNAQLDLARIQEGLVMYYTRKATYPLDLEELLENGDLNKVPKDPWGTDYLYVPHLDWARFVRLLGTSSSSSSSSGSSSSNAGGGGGGGGQPQKRTSASMNSNMIYYKEALKRMRNSLMNLPESIEKIQVLAMAMDQPFCICVGTKLPRFPPKIDTNVTREKIKYVAQLMKMARERSEGELNELVTEVLNIAKE